MPERQSASGKRSARRSVRFAAWKAPNETPVVAISWKPRAVRVDQRCDVPDAASPRSPSAGAHAPRAAATRRASCPRVPRVDAVELHATGVDQPRERSDHPALLPFVAIAFLRGEDEHRTAVMAEHEHAVELVASHARLRSTSSARCGWSTSRQETQLCASGCSTRRTSQPRSSERLREEAVVVEVLLAGAARERHRNRIWAAAAARDDRDEARDPLEARRPTPRAHRTGGGRSCRTGGRDRRAGPDVSHCACRRDSAPRLAPSATGGAETGAASASAGSHSSASARA